MPLVSFNASGREMSTNYIEAYYGGTGPTTGAEKAALYEDGITTTASYGSCAVIPPFTNFETFDSFNNGLSHYNRSFQRIGVITKSGVQYQMYSDSDSAFNYPRPLISPENGSAQIYERIFYWWNELCQAHRWRHNELIDSNGNFIFYMFFNGEPHRFTPSNEEPYQLLGYNFSDPYFLNHIYKIWFFIFCRLNLINSVQLYSSLDSINDVPLDEYIMKRAFESGEFTFNNVRVNSSFHFQNSHLGAPNLISHVLGCQIYTDLVTGESFNTGTFNGMRSARQERFLNHLGSVVVGRTWLRSRFFLAGITGTTFMSLTTNKQEADLGLNGEVFYYGDWIGNYPDKIKPEFSVGSDKYFAYGQDIGYNYNEIMQTGESQRLSIFSIGRSNQNEGMRLPGNAGREFTPSNNYVSCPSFQIARGVRGLAPEYQLPQKMYNTFFARIQQRFPSTNIVLINADTNAVVSTSLIEQSILNDYLSNSVDHFNNLQFGDCEYYYSPTSELVSFKNNFYVDANSASPYLYGVTGNAGGTAGTSFNVSYNYMNVVKPGFNSAINVTFNPFHVFQSFTAQVIQLRGLDLLDEFEGSDMDGTYTMNTGYSGYDHDNNRTLRSLTGASGFGEIAYDKHLLSVKSVSGTNRTLSDGLSKLVYGFVNLNDFVDEKQYDATVRDVQGLPSLDWNVLMPHRYTCRKIGERLKTGAYSDFTSLNAILDVPCPDGFTHMFIACVPNTLGITYSELVSYCNMQTMNMKVVNATTNAVLDTFPVTYLSQTSPFANVFPTRCTCDIYHGPNGLQNDKSWWFGPTYQAYKIDKANMNNTSSDTIFSQYTETLANKYVASNMFDVDCENYVYSPYQHNMSACYSMLRDKFDSDNWENTVPGIYRNGTLVTTGEYNEIRW